MTQPRILNINTQHIKPLIPDEKDDNPSVSSFLFPFDTHLLKNECLSTHTIAQFNTSGDHIYIGTNEGMITVLDSATLKVTLLAPLQLTIVQTKKSFSIAEEYSNAKAGIKSFAFSRDDIAFLVNCTGSYSKPARGLTL